MKKFCLDSNIFIEAKNRFYGFDFVPAFWDFLEKEFSKGSIYSSQMIYKELDAKDDDISQWIKNIDQKEVFIIPNESVQKEYGEIADFINNEVAKRKYRAADVKNFLDKADAWVIAQAKVDGTIVATQETKIQAYSKKVKIPNICEQFKVQYVDCFEMLRNLNARFILQ